MITPVLTISLIALVAWVAIVLLAWAMCRAASRADRDLEDAYEQPSGVILGV